MRAHGELVWAWLALCAMGGLAYPAACTEEGLGKMEEGQTLALSGRKAVISKLDMLPYVENEYSKRHVFEAYNNPRLTELRTRYGLEQVIAPGKDEFEKQLLLMDWVRARIPGGDPGRLGGLRDALKILDLSEKGQRFFCTQCAATYMSAAASLGWIDRGLSLRRPNQMSGSSPEHTSSEIWSNQYRKWVMFDATFALYAQKDGVPASAWEIRQDFFYNDAKNLVFVDRRNGRNYRKSEVEKCYPAQLYAFIGYVPNTNWLDSPPDWGNMFISKTDDEVCRGTKWHERVCPENPAVDPYFPVNQAALSLSPAASDLTVRITTLTPNFKTFRIRVDDREWTDCKSTLAWALHEGTNTLQAKSVNLFDVDGPVSTVQLQVLPAPSAAAEAPRPIAKPAGSP